MTENEASEDPFGPDRTYDAALRLLDRQIIDPDGALLGKVDDLEISYTPGQPPQVTAILIGPGPWAGRMPGILGRYTAAIWQRLRPQTDPEPCRIPLHAVTSIDSAIHISIPKSQAPTGTLEAWVHDHIIGKIPGAAHAPE